MSGSTDDAQRTTSPEIVTSTVGTAGPGEDTSSPDTDDVEVLAQQPSDQVAARHDSVLPTSRKLAPPPKPKRDSANPGSMPPPATAPQDATASPRDAAAEALSSNGSLRVIGEALSRNAGAFSATEAPTGGRPEVALRAQGEEARAPEPSASSAVPSSSAIFVQRIISVGTPSARPLPTKVEPPPPALDSVPTLPSELRLAPAAPVSPVAPVAPHVETAQPPLVAPLPAFPVPPSPSPPPPPPLDLAPLAEIPPPPAAPAPAPEPSVTVEIHVEEGPTELASTDIPITTEDEEERPPAPPASEVPLAASSVSPDSAPVMLTREETEALDELTPRHAVLDSAERAQVEELSREDSPSIPPEAPVMAAPPPLPTREGKPPPPPRRAPAPPREELTSPDVEKKKASKQKRPWWEELFSEDFVRASWKVSDEQIKREVTFVEESLGVAPGGVVLDLGCGPGQHAVELASRGYGVVGYDLSLYQLALAADIAQERSQKINFLQGDMREMAFEEMFDGIFCWNTSFGYFEEDKNFAVAERAFRALRPGGMFLVDVMNRDFVAAHTPSSVWFEGDSCVCMDDAVIDYYTSRLRVKRSIILDDGRTRECTYSVRLYSFHELGKLLHEVGFRVTEVSGHPSTPGVFLGQASPRILMLAQRP